MNYLEIESVIGREILDSRGNPTVEAEITLADGTVARGCAPSAPLCQAYHLHSYKFLAIKNFHTKNRHLRRFKNCIFLFFCNHNLIFIAV